MLKPFSRLKLPLYLFLLSAMACVRVLPSGKNTDGRSHANPSAAGFALPPASVHHLQALSQGVVPTDVTIRGVTYAGPGCPATTVAYNLAPDAKAFTLLFAEFTASVGGAAQESDRRSSCQINLDIVAPPGYSYNVVTHDVRGFASLEAGVLANLGTTFYFQGNLETDHFNKILSGPIAEDYVFHNEFNLDQVASPCEGESRSLNINTEVVLDNSLAPGTSGYVSVDSIDGEFTLSRHDYMHTDCHKIIMISVVRIARLLSKRGNVDGRGKSGGQAGAIIN